MAKHITLNKVHYTTLKNARDKVREILYRVAEMEDLSGDDFLVVKDLFLNHPEASIKAPDGIHGFVVKTVYQSGHATKCFNVRRQDGTLVDFSFNVALRGELTSLQTLILAACREAVFDQICAFKSKASQIGYFQCAISGIPIDPDDAECDHLAPVTFQKLVNDWQLVLANEGHQAISEYDLSSNAEVRTEVVFVNQSLRESFARYHEAYAVLRIIHCDVHRRLKRAS